MQNCSHDKIATLRTVYETASPKMEADLAKFRKRYKTLHTRKISYATFVRVITLYFYYVFIEIINNGTIFKMYQRFGNMFAVKTKCTRYTPKRVLFRKNEKGEVVARTAYLNLSKSNGYVPFIFWDSPEKWRHYRFTPVMKYKRLLFGSLMNGNDYLDYTIQSNKSLIYSRA